MRFFDNRQAAQAAFIEPEHNSILVVHDGDLLAYERGSAYSALRSNGGSVDWKPLDLHTIRHWGAVGNYDGTTGANSTEAINNALKWHSRAGDGQRLHIPCGWFYYDGETSLDYRDARAISLTCDGQITLGASKPIAWELHNFESGLIQINLRNGGKTGNFSQATPTGGGTTAIQVHNTQWARFKISAMNYQGRVLHGTCKTLKAEDRNIRAHVEMTFGQRQIVGDDRLCGQPLYWEHGEVSNTGGTGSFSLTGSGCRYGPVFERCNDVTLPEWEFGPCTVQGPKMRGVGPLLVPNWWVGECADHCIAAEPGPKGSRNFEWHFGAMKVFRSGGAGAYLSGFAQGKPSMRVNSCMATKSGGPGFHLHDVKGAVVIDAMGVDRATSGIKITGQSGDMKIHFDYDIGLTGPRVIDQSTGGNVVVT